MPSWQDLCQASDADLINQLQAKNDDALAVIIDRYQRLVFHVALRIVKDEGEAEDLTQAVFLEVFRNAKQYDSKRGTLKVWLLQYAYSRSLNRRVHLQRREFYSLPPAVDDNDASQSGSSFGGGKLSHQERSVLLRQGMASLNARQKQAIELIHFEGLSFAQAAKQTGQSLSAVRHQYYRAIEALRQFLGAKACRDSKEITDGGAIGTEVVDAST